MRRTLLAGLALALASTPAAAGNDSQWLTGDCAYTTVDDADRYQGLVYGYAVVYSLSDPSTPVTATVTCTLSVDNEPVHQMVATGTTVVAGAERLDFVATPDQHIGLCMSVDFADDTPTYETCYESIPWQFPPQEVYDVVWGAPSLVPGLHEAVCAATDEGDLYVDEYQLVSCPPQG